MCPWDRSKYPKNWKEIRGRILTRAKFRCECSGECKLHQGYRCRERNMMDAQWAKGRVILTVAHLDHDPSNNKDSNLKAMCQRCHLRYDKDQHGFNASLTRDRKKGQIRLFRNEGV